jgi:hypothetical protein
VPRDAPLKDHLEDLLTRFNQLSLGERLAGRDGIRIYVNVGVIFPTACVTLEIDDRQMLAIASNRMTLDISAYPCRED